MYIIKNLAEYLSYKQVTHDAGSYIEMHQHDSAIGGYDFEIVYVMEGSATHIVGKEKYKIAKGDYFFVDYGVSHGYKIDEGEDLHIINLVFDYRAVDHWFKRIQSLSELATLHGIDPIVEDKSIKTDYLFHDGEDKRVLQAFLDISTELSERLPGYHETVKCKLMEILIKGFRQYFNLNSDIICSPPIRAIIDYLGAYYMNDTKLSDHAKLLHISLPHLSKKFKEEIGQTYTQYLHRRRITESCRILSTSDTPIEFVAEYVGYSDSKKYREKFREYMGVSPREYRKAMVTS